VPAATCHIAANLSVNELILRVVWGSFKRNGITLPSLWEPSERRGKFLP